MDGNTDCVHNQMENLTTIKVEATDEVLQNSVSFQTCPTLKNESTEENLHSCNLCDYQTVVFGNLEKHLLLHKERKPYLCDICDFYTEVSEKLEEHVLLHEEKDLYKCTLCDYSTCVSENLEKHLMLHTDEAPYKCNLCDYDTNDPAKLQNHRKLHTGTKPYTCSLCDYDTDVYDNFVKHVLLHANEKPYSCDMCDYCTVNSELLEKHFLLHTADKAEPYKCNVCTYVTTQFGNFKRHLLTHKGKRSYNCYLCDFSTLHYANLKRHTMAVHTRKESSEEKSESSEYDEPKTEEVMECRLRHKGRSHNCNLCDHNPSGLRWYRKIPWTRKRKPYKCKFCGDMYRYKREHICKGKKPHKHDTCKLCGLDTLYVGILRKHLLIRSQTKTKLHQCNLCDFTTVHLSRLSRHLLFNHFKCDKCNYSTTVSSKLRRHIRLKHPGEKSHSGAKLYISCDICSYRTGSSKLLQRHKLKHTKQKARKRCKSTQTTKQPKRLWRYKRKALYKCSSCDFSSENPAALQVHKLKHTGDKKYACDLCEFKTSQRWILTMHKKIHKAGTNTTHVSVVIKHGFQHQWKSPLHGLHVTQVNINVQ